jgi:hypothetical protein
MGLKTNSSPVDARLSKMEVAIENIASLVVAGNLTINQLMAREAAMGITTKVAYVEEPKCTIVMAKNVRQVVNRAVETLADVPKQEERKFNLCLMGFEAKEGETEKELVEWLNTELLQGQMRLRAKVIVATRQRPTTTWASTSTIGTRFGVVLFKYAMSKDRQVALRGHNGLTGTKLGLDEDLTPMQQVRKLELWSLFKEAKATSKCAF